ncbi:MAG TPA: ABC transporter permease [Candidatus Limnocylindrales bacterium]|nr:ABC transporter permease [Candidatus Limnocylindrales bacterium]
MTESTRERQIAAVARAENPPADRNGLRTALMAVGIVIILLVLWEGAKWFAAVNHYAIQLGPLQVDLTLLNDTQLPHLTDIVASLGEPAQRNGVPLWQMLLESVAFTFYSAFLGFVIGGLFGFALAVVFAHFNALQRGMMPFVVASQTVPILAIAPMIVIWMGRAGNVAMAVPVIAAYLTFFPVTIYSLRGLTTVPPTALELMQSYAASKREIFMKLRLPNALPHIFTALKIASTASVVGAIIGELPSGIQTGMGIAILNFSRYYNQSPSRLWATILIAGLVGILFFALIALVERLVVRWRPADGK